MSEQNPNPDPASDWQFGVRDEPVTRADIQRLESLIAQQAQHGRPAIDPSTLADDSEREIASILERLEKQPVKGFKDHTDYIVKQVGAAVTKQVTESVQQQIGGLIEAQQRDAFAEAIAKRIGVGLGESGVDYIRTYLGSYDMRGLRGIAADKPTLDMLRNGAENVAGRGAERSPVSSGGTSGAGTGAPPSNMTNAQEADAQEMFQSMKHIKGYTIEMARKAVTDLGSDPSVIAQRSPEAWG